MVVNVPMWEFSPMEALSPITAKSSMVTPWAILAEAGIDAFGDMRSAVVDQLLDGAESVAPQHEERDPEGDQGPEDEAPLLVQHSRVPLFGWARATCAFVINRAPL